MPAQPVLFCSHVVEWGGAERVLADLLATLDRDRIAPHLACPGPGPLVDFVVAHGIPVHTTALGGSTPLAKAMSLPGAARALRRSAARIGARLLYANTMIAGYAGALAQGRDLRCLWHVHTVTSSTFARLAAARMAAVITPSRAGAESLRQAVDGARVHVIENGIPPAFFAEPATGLRAELGLDAGVGLIGIVGRIDPHKGHAILMQACRALTDLPFHIVVAGAEAFADSQARIRGHGRELEDLAAELDLASRISFLGHRDDLPELLGQLDVVVVPSIAAESAPRGIAEAQAAGRAVIASDIGGTREMIDDGRTGRLVPPGDIGALADALRELLTEDARRLTLGRAAREHARDRYSMPAFTRDIESVCERVLGRATRP